MRRRSRVGLAVLASLGSVAVVATPASAALVLVSSGANYTSSPTSFTFGDSSFTFSATGDIFNPTAVSTGGTGQVNTVFGNPTSNFINRGTVTFNASQQYAAFATPTAIPFSNGDNFIGLRATSGANVFFGYAFTTNTVLNGAVFNNVPGQSITASATLPSAVPEPATWAMMLFGFGAAGIALRRRVVPALRAA